nr:class I SAM-dependent methyltransferase [Leucobacter exalbidus]
MIVTVDDRLTADDAVKYAAQGISMLWLGDFHNAKQILGAIDRRVAKGGSGTRKRKRTLAEAAEAPETRAEEFYRLRQARAGRSRIMSMILVPLERDEDGTAKLPLHRAPKIGAVIDFGYKEQTWSDGGRAIVSLQELIGVQGAHQWYVNGVDVPALDARIHPHYGTFMPTRNEYVDLVNQAPMGDLDLAFDIGTGTGVLAALLVARGVRDVIGTDIHQRSVDCANDNFARLGMQNYAVAQVTDMFPEGRAPLVVCNPPWLPGSATTTLDAAVYDPGSKMLLQFLAGLPDHLTEFGEGWLLLSDLAEILGLRTRQMLLDAIDQAGLEVYDRLDTYPTHGRATDTTDVLHEARSREVTSLWRLRVKE